MSTNRAALINKLHKSLKKMFDPVLPDASRSLLEHLLFASLLENASPEAAESSISQIHDRFFDLNEVRVTTIRELSEVTSGIPDAEEAAGRLKRILQSVFESHYAFDIEHLKKLNIGQAVKELERYDGVDEFAIAYVTQVSLGGHAIPVSSGSLRALYVVGVISDAEFEEGRVPGLERAIPKNKAPEFSSLLQQLGAKVYGSPYGTKTRKMLLDLAPDGKDRLPKRPSLKPAEPAAEEEPTRTKSAKQGPTAAGASESDADSKAAAATAAKKKSAAKKKPAAKKSDAPKKSASKPAKEAAPKKKSGKKSAAAKKKTSAAKGTAKKKASLKTKKKTKSKSSTSRLAKRKPR